MLLTSLETECLNGMPSELYNPVQLRANVCSHHPDDFTLANDHILSATSGRTPARWLRVYANVVIWALRSTLERRDDLCDPY